MANETQEKKIFKYGDQEFALDDLLKLHTEQEHNFYNFAKTRGQYDDEALVGLRRALIARINAAKNGEAFSGDGILDTDKVDNTTITTQKKGLFKKEKYVEQDNTEWAKYYFNKLMSQLKPYQKSKDKDTWDIRKHGLEAYLTGQGLNAKDIFEKQDLQDENNPDNPRSFTERHNLLRNQLQGYKNWLQSKGFDFTKNDNEWDDDFMTSLDTLLNNQDWSNSAVLAANLRKLGAGDNYTTAFTSDKWDLTKTNAQLDAEAKARKEREEQEKEASYLREWENYAYSKKRSGGPSYYSPFNYLDSQFDGKYKDFRSWYGDLNATERQKYGTYLGTDNSAWNNAWVKFTQALKDGTSYTDKNAGVLLQGAFETQPHLFLDLGDGNYLIKDSVNTDGQGMVYNPKNGYTGHVFLGDLATKHEDIRNEYKRLAYDYINKQHGTDYSSRQYVFAEGGPLIPVHQFGGQANFNWGSTDEVVKPKAEENDVTIKTQRAKDQYLDSDNQSIDNPNAGWDAKHYARLGSAVADLGAAVAGFVPVYGTIASAILGVGSTITNFITDATDDAVTSDEMWSNLGLNLGMDVLGLIPGGGAASKMGKIIKTLKGTVPLIVALPGVASMLANSPEIAESWKKAFDGDSEDGGSKMDYQDYMNILQVLNVAAGATNISRNMYQSSKKSVAHSDKIAVDVQVKNKSGQAGPQRKALIFEGEDAVKFKEANAEGKAQEFIDKIEGGNKYIINEVTSRNIKPWSKGADGKRHLQNPFGRTATGQAKVLEVRWEAPSANNPKGRYYAETGAWDADLVGKDLVRMKDKTTLDAWQKKHQSALDTQFTAWRQRAAAYKTTTDRAEKLRQKVEAAIAAQTTQKQALDAELATQQRISQEAGSKSTRIQQWLDNGGTEASWKKIGEARTRIAEIDKTLKKKSITNDEAIALQTERAKLEKAMHDAEIELTGNTPEAVQVLNDQVLKANSEQTRLQTETTKLQAMLDRLNRHRTYFNTIAKAGNSNAYKSIRDFKAIKKKFNGTEYTFDVAPDLKKLDGLYKRGGSINRNKINKFLNYAKG